MRIAYGKEITGRGQVSLVEARRSADTVLRHLHELGTLPPQGDAITEDCNGDEVIVVASGPGSYRVRVNTRAGGYALMTASILTDSGPWTPAREGGVKHRSRGRLRVPPGPIPKGG